MQHIMCRKSVGILWRSSDRKQYVTNTLLGVCRYMQIEFLYYYYYYYYYYSHYYFHYHYYYHSSHYYYYYYFLIYNITHRRMFISKV